MNLSENKPSKPGHRRLGSGSPKPTHRRLGSRPMPSFGLDGTGETLTTSKAVMLSVVAPCMYHTASEPVVQKVKDDDKKNKKAEPASPTEDDNSSSSSSDDDEDEGTSSTERKKSAFRGAQNLVAAPGTLSGGRSVLEPEEDAIPMREWISVANQESQEITMEEASAVKRQDHDPNQAEINIEELLRISFQALLDERYLLNVPTFSRVEDKKVIKVALMGSMNNLNGDINGKPIPWIRVETMALPASLGIILDRLERIGIGTIVGTLSVYKVELCRTASPYLQPPPSKKSSKADSVMTESTRGSAAGADAASHRGFEASMRGQSERVPDSEEDEKQKSERLIEEARNEWKNAATRLRIEQIREQIGEQAALSFDFLSLLTIAGILAGIGLVTDNSVVIVASMLVSPIMGPVLGLTFGTQVKDWPLVKGSLINETIALLVCILIGILIGLCTGFTDYAQTEWPTNEMESRGKPIGLITGIAVAIPSGAGVCLSVIGGNTSSLVGVAISASLLPPAVNAGICFMQAVLIAAGAVESPPSESDVHFASIGAISFSLTVVNIVCIWMAGIVMFHVKEVSPSENKGAFWARDLRVAREINKKKKEGKARPVDAKALRDGIISALSKKNLFDDKKPAEKVKIRAPHPVVRPYRQGYQPTNLNAAFAFKPQRQSTNNTHDQPLWWRDLVETEAAEEEDAQYINLDAVADLLGVGSYDDDDDDDIPAVYWTRYGGGRYIY